MFKQLLKNKNTLLILSATFFVLIFLIIPIKQIHAGNPWTQYPSNPVFTDPNDINAFASVLKDPDTNIFHMYYMSSTNTHHATSSDGISWNIDTANNPVLTDGNVPMVWKEGSTWYMLYRYLISGRYVIALATSSDGISWTKYAGNPILSETNDWYNGVEAWGIIKVGSTYYMYYSDWSVNRKIGLATSTDLINWTKDSSNPIFTGGRFCPFVFKYEDYYYILVPHYTSGSDYSDIELYRDTSPTFYSGSREFVRTAIVHGSSGAWNDIDQDTPVVLTDDIYRNTYNLTNNQLWTYFAGATGVPDVLNDFKVGLAIETDIPNALMPDIVPPVITVTGYDPYYIYQNELYADLGATALDDQDGNITNNINTTNNVNTAIIGQQTVTYVVSDTTGNTSTSTRKVHVVEYDPPESVSSITIDNLSVVDNLDYSITATGLGVSNFGSVSDISYQIDSTTGSWTSTTLSNPLQTNQIDNTFSTGTGANDTIYSTAIGPDGKIIISGNIKGYNGAAINKIARLDQYGTMDYSFYSRANDTIYSTAIDSDGKIMIGGDFSSYDGFASRITKLDLDGTSDEIFKPEIGTNGPVYSIFIKENNEVLIGGNFTQYEGMTVGNFAMLDDRGSPLEIIGTNGPVYAIASTTNGFIIAGNFSTYNEANINKIVLLSSIGEINPSFNPENGANESIYAVAVQSDGKIIIGGGFNQYNDVEANYITRLNTNGTRDESFSTSGVDGIVRSISIQQNGKIIIGGEFSGKIARLNTDGTIDTDFNTGTGANDTIYSTTIDSDGKIIIGGNFTSYNDTGANYIARIYNTYSSDFLAEKISTNGLDIGSHTIYFRIVDENGNTNIGNYASSTFTVLSSDMTSPTSTISINSGNIYTNSTSVTLTFTAEDETSATSSLQMMISNYSDFTDASWENYTTSKSWALLGTQGTNIVYFKVRDVARNESATSTDTIIFDNIAPIDTSDVWTEYSNNPVFTDPDGIIPFSSIFKDYDTGIFHMFYTNDTNIRHATSSDGINWNIDTTNNPVLTNAQIGTAWKENSTWNMLYRYQISGIYVIGLATSTDAINWNKYSGNPILQRDNTDWKYGVEAWGVIKVGTIYYMYYSDWGTGAYINQRKIGLATSTDLINWTKDPNNPIFSDGRFCSFIFKHGNYYYMLMPYYTVGTDYSVYELYRDINPTFHQESRELVKIPFVYGVSGTWNDTDMDTPVVLTDDIYRNTYNLTNNELWVYVAGGRSLLNLWTEGILIESDMTEALSPDATRHVNETNVTLDFKASDNRTATSSLQMMISNYSDFSGSSWENYSASKSWTILGTTGINTVYFKVKDEAGNVSSTSTDTIIFDNTSPTGSIIIDNNNIQTNITSVNLTLSATDDISGVSGISMMISNNSSFSGASWESYSTSKSWTISTGNGTKTVYIKFRDEALNESSIYSDTIEYITYSGGSGGRSTYTPPTIVIPEIPIVTPTTTPTSTIIVPIDPVVPPISSQTMLFKYSNDPKVYILENGIRRWIKDEYTFNKLGYNWSDIQVVDETTTAYSPGTDIVVEPPQFVFTRTLKPRSVGADVKELQTLLKHLGFFTYYTTTNFFGTQTYNAVIKFQKANNIKVTGIVDEKTREVLNKLLVH